MPKLQVRRPLRDPYDIELDAAHYAIGRAADNDIVLEGSGVSRHHCVLEQEGNSYRIRDLASHNGVSVNGRNVPGALLQPGDEVRVGNVLLVYEPRDERREPISAVTFEADYDSVVSELSGTRPLRPGATRAELEDERRTLSLLCDLSRELANVSSLEDVARRAVDVLLETTRAERGAIFLLEGEKGPLRPMFVSGGGEDDRLAAVTLSSTVADRILTERKGVITADAADDPRFAHGHSVVLYGLKSICCAPLVGKAGNLGILYLENNRAVGAFDEDDLKLLIAVASQIGLAVENARFFDALRRSNEELERQVEERTARLRETELRLYQTEKMMSLSRLVAGVAHEINSPLSALKANLDLIETLARRLKPAADSGAGTAAPAASEADQGAALDTLVSILRESASACGRIIGVVRSLRSYARLDESEYKIANVNDGLATVVSLVDPAARRHVEILLTPGDVPPIGCFPALLNEAFMNLIVNACQACQSQGGGTVWIQTRQDGADVVVTIRDNGPGIAPEHRAKIFDPGFTTRGVGVGLGLGLSVAYLVVREHRGTIDFETERGHGSTFTIRLPQSPG